MQDMTNLQILWTSLATSTYYVLFAVAFALVLKVNGCSISPRPGS